MIKLNTDSAIISEDIAEILSAKLPWTSLSGKTVAVTGAYGMLAAYVVETLLALGKVKVVALVRSEAKARERFHGHLDNPLLSIREYACKAPLPDIGPFNFIVHAASIPRPDKEIPVDVLTPNVIGTYHLLEAAREQPLFEQFIFFSSGAVYGEMKSSEPINEDMTFPIDQSDVANCYAIGKVTGESLCAAYRRQYGISTKMLRLAHTYGPGMDLNGDIRAFSEFIRSALQGDKITLHTAGTQKRSYCYISDATRAFFEILFNGKCGNAYNLVNQAESYSIRAFAELVAANAPRPIAIETGMQPTSGGYAPQHNAAILSDRKIKALGWTPTVGLAEGLRRTMATYTA